MVFLITVSCLYTEQSRRVEQENASLSNAYSEKSQSQLSAFQTRLQTHQEQQEALFSDVSSSIDQLQTVHSAGLSDLMQCMNTMNSLLEDQKAKIEEESKKEQALQSEQKSEVQELLGHQQGAIQEQLQQFMKLTQRHAEAMNEEAARSKSKTAKSLEAVKAKLADSRVSVSNFVTEQTRTMTELQTSIDQSIQEQMQQLQTHNESLMSSLQASHAQHQKELDSVKTQVTQFVDACMASQVEKLREQTSMIESNGAAQQKQLGCVIKVTKHGVNSSTNAINDLDSAHETASTELQEMVDATGTQISASSKRHIELVASHSSGCEDWKKEIETAGSTHVTTMTTVLDKQEQSTQEWITEKQDNAAKFMSSHHEIGGKLSSGVDSMETSLKSNVGGTKRKLGAVSELVQQVLQESTSESSIQKEELTSFIESRQVSPIVGCGSVFLGLKELRFLLKIPGNRTVGIHTTQEAAGLPSVRGHFSATKGYGYTVWEAERSPADVHGDPEEVSELVINVSLNYEYTLLCCLLVAVTRLAIFCPSVTLIKCVKLTGLVERENGGC